MTRAKRLVLTSVTVVAGLLLTAAFGLWYVIAGKDAFTAHRYASQVSALSLPRDFRLVSSSKGGTYFAAGSGPYASRGYRTALAPDVAVTAVEASLRAHGYRLTSDPQSLTTGFPVKVPMTRLTARNDQGPVEVLITAGDAYDLPAADLPPIEGLTNVLVVVEDDGRTSR